MRVERLEHEFEVAVEWYPFELHPEIPPRGKELGGRSAFHYEQFRLLAEESGLSFRPPQRIPNSHLSLEAGEFAREHGAFRPYHRALFEAYFARGEDIGDGRVLCELASAHGLDAAALEDAIASGRYASLVNERSEEARRWGITGTPTFVFEDGDRRFALVGAQDDDVFASVAQRLGAARRAAEPV